MYAVNATVTFTSEEENWTVTRQVPTFYLDENVQGIVDEWHAMEIARTIVNPFSDPNILTAITVVAT